MQRKAKVKAKAKKTKSKAKAKPRTSSGYAPLSRASPRSFSRSAS